MELPVFDDTFQSAVFTCPGEDQSVVESGGSSSESEGNWRGTPLTIDKVT